MSEDVTTGIVLEGKDEVSSVLDRIARNVDRMADGAEKDFERAEEGADELTQAINDNAAATAALTVGFDAAAEGLRMLVEGTIESINLSIEQRAETDEQRIAWENMLDEITDLRAEFAEQLIPVILQVFEAVQPVIKAIQDAGEASSFTSEAVGEFLVSALRVAVGAWFLFQQAIETVNVVLNEFVESALGKVEDLLGGFAGLAEAVGADGLANGIREAQETVAEFGDIAGDVADDASARLAELETAWADLDEGIRQGAIEGQRFYRSEVEKTSAVELRAIERTQEARDAARERREQRDAEDAARRKAELDALREAELEALALLEQQALELQDIATIAGENFVGAIEDGANVAEAVAGSALRAFVELIKGQIQALIAKATAEAIAGHAGIPFVGLAIGAGVAAAATGLIEAALSGVPGFATGGFVPGQGPSQDSVLVRAQPRELIVNAAQQQVLMRALQGQGVPGGGGRTVNQTNNLMIQSLIPQTPADLDRSIRDGFIPAQRRLKELA
jgi:hypothetical protein